MKILFIIIGWYLIFSFVIGEFNPIVWWVGYRLLYVVLAGANSLIYYFIYQKIEKFKDETI